MKPKKKSYDNSTLLAIMVLFVLSFLHAFIPNWGEQSMNAAWGFTAGITFMMLTGMLYVNIIEIKGLQKY